MYRVTIEKVAVKMAVDTRWALLTMEQATALQKKGVKVTARERDDRDFDKFPFEANIPMLDPSKESTKILEQVVDDIDLQRVICAINSMSTCAGQPLQIVDVSRVGSVLSPKGNRARRRRRTS